MRQANFRNKETQEEIFVANWSIKIREGQTCYFDSKGNELKNFEFIEQERENYKGISFNSSEQQQYESISKTMHKRAKEFDKTEGAKRKQDLIKKTVRAANRKYNKNESE